MRVALLLSREVKMGGHVTMRVRVTPTTLTLVRSAGGKAPIKAGGVRELAVFFWGQVLFCYNNSPIKQDIPKTGDPQYLSKQEIIVKNRSRRAM